MTSSVFPQPCFLNSAALLTQPLCTVFRCGELKFILLPWSTCEIAAGTRKDLLYRGRAFPCLGGGSFTGLFITHCSHLLNLWALLFWATDLIRQLTVISQWPIAPAAEISRPADYVPTLSQQHHKLCLSSCRTAVLQGNTPSGIPAHLHLFSSITSASGWETSRLSLRHDLTPCFSSSIAKLVWRLPFLAPALLCSALPMTTMCCPSLCRDICFGILPHWQACQSCTSLSFSVLSNEDKSLMEF